MELLNSLEKEDILEVLSASDGFCNHCDSLLRARITTLLSNKTKTKRKLDQINSFGANDATDVHLGDNNNSNASNSLSFTPPKTTATLVVNNNIGKHLPHSQLLLNDGICGGVSSFENVSDEQKDFLRYSQVHSTKDFTLIERVYGRNINVLNGLQLHTGVFNATEQKNILEFIYRLEWRGQHGKLKERTYSKPRKWMRGKGRATIQFGCCYNYAVDKNGNPPGIIRDEEVDPLPAVFKQMIKRMVRWNIVPSTCIPNSCIVNIYEVGDCIPPHIDHHDFVRPFYTVSFLNECQILFGSNLQAIRPGEFSGPASILLPVGSVFVLNGNGANVAKHCIPSVSSKRISITFRKMDESKLPYNFSPDPELQPEGIKPVTIIQSLNKQVGNLETQQQKKAQSTVDSESESADTASKTRKGIQDGFSPTNEGDFRKSKVRRARH